MNTARARPLGLTQLRAFAAVARQLNFRAAADDMALTQSAISRQIKSLEDDLGAPLFDRGTRHVALTAQGRALLDVVEPWLQRLDATVQQLRGRRSRSGITITTFASFASLWLLPRIEAFQHSHPDTDIRVAANDQLADLDDPEIDLALRYCTAEQAPPGAVRMFGETLTPVISRSLAAQIAAGQAPPLARPADLAAHTLAEEDDNRPSGRTLSWRRWLATQGVGGLEPRRWMLLNFTYQQVQAALAGQGVALARLALVGDAIERGELVEPFGPAGRTHTPSAYWMVLTAVGAQRQEVLRFRDWVLEQARATRAALGEAQADLAPSLSAPRPR
jgi:LysR family glycine cleavage system transcriptional activator